MIFDLTAINYAIVAARDDGNFILKSVILIGLS